MRHNGKKAQNISFLMVFLLLFGLDSIIVSGQGAVVPLSWGTEQNPDFSDWSEKVPAENTVGYHRNRAGVWKSTTVPENYTRVGKTEYLLAGGVGELDVEFEFQFDLGDSDTSAYWDIIIVDTNQIQYILGGFIFTENPGGFEPWLRVFMLSSGGAGYGDIARKPGWHTVQITIDVDSTFIVLWDGETLSNGGAAGSGALLEKITVNTWKSDLYFSSWALSAHALNPGNGDGSAAGDVLTGEDRSPGWDWSDIWVIPVGVVLAGAATAYMVKRKKKYPVPPMKEAAGCPYCQARFDPGDQFCSDCGQPLNP